MNFKLEYNNEIHILSQKPSSLFDLRKYVRNIYDDLKKTDFFHLQYNDKDGFSITIQNEQDYNLALQNAADLKLSSLKFFIILDNTNSHFCLLSQERGMVLNLKTPSTFNECGIQGKNKCFLFDNSNTTSSDEKFTNRDSIAPDLLEKDKGTFKIEEPLSFIRVEEEKTINDRNIKELKREKIKGKEELILNENIFNSVEKFHFVKCYKCKGSGLNSKKTNKKCKKCNGTGDFTSSTKISVIDYFIKEKLQNIYTEYEQKKSFLEESNKKYFASETIHNSNIHAGVCTICGYTIESAGVKYKCSKCPLLTFCVKCEENVDHPHPLMKFKKHTEKGRIHFSNSVQLPYPYSQSESLSLNKSIKRPIGNLETSCKLTNSSSSINYKAKFFNEHLMEKVAIGTEFLMLFTIKNNGDCKWPENMELICISGFYQSTSVGVPSLNINEKHTVNLTLQAPKNEETLNSSWRLGYLNRNDKKFFGPKINSTIMAMKPEKLAFKEQKDIKKKFISH